jgi:hypothetical protein
LPPQDAEIARVRPFILHALDRAVKRRHGVSID